jgi:hypothetical protein
VRHWNDRGRRVFPWPKSHSLPAKDPGMVSFRLAKLAGGDFQGP